MKCNYCGKEAEWVENKEIYGRNYWESYMMWLCRDCNAYVWCHQNTKKPYGTLANPRTRLWRKLAKDLFIKKMLGWEWKVNHKKKFSAYKKLAKMLDIKVKDTHFWMFNEEQCKKVIKILKINL